MTFFRNLRAWADYWFYAVITTFLPQRIKNDDGEKEADK